MNLELDGDLQNFGAANYGDILVARVGEHCILRGMKSFFPGDSKPVDQFVTLRPFTDDDGGMPSVYDPHALRGRPILNITQSCYFSVSFDPVDLIFELPTTRQSLGLALIRHSHILVGVKFSVGGGGSWQTMFLNLGSGEIERDPKYTTVFASKRWWLFKPRRDEPGEPLHEYIWSNEGAG